MKLLFIHEVDWIHKVKYEIHELPEQLSLRGHEIDFIDFPEETPLAGKLGFPGFRTVNRVITSYTYPGSRVRVISPGRILPAPLDRLVATLTFLPALVSRIRKQRYDAIVLYAVPTNGWQTVVVARLMGVPVIFRALDVSHLIRKTKLRAIVRVAERFVYRRVNWLSANNSELLSYCVANGASVSKSSTNYPGLDISHFARPTRNVTLRKALDISENTRVLIFVGTLFVFCGLDRVLSDFATLDTQSLDVKLLILGDGDLFKELKRMVVAHGLESKVMLLGRINFEQLGDYLSLADVAVMPFRSEVVSELALPWKVVQYLAAGVPVVASPLKGLMSAFPPGVGVRYVNPSETFAKIMCDLAFNTKEIEQLVSRGSQTVRSKFLWDDNIREFEEMIRQVSGRLQSQRNPQ